jgi:LemA protein
MIGYYNSMKVLENLIEQKKKEILNAAQKKKILENNLAVLFSKYTSYDQLTISNITSNYANLIATAQLYPSLLTDSIFIENYKKLEKLTTEIQSKISDYNVTITDYNNNIKQFPQMILAFIFGFKVKIYAELK